MRYVLTDTTNPFAPRVIGFGFTTPAEAFAVLVRAGEKPYVEEDDDNPGCWDVFCLTSGNIYKVEPR